MVCPAPIPRSSGGRSEVSTIRGTPAWSASTTAGWRLAAADPLVQATIVGEPVASAAPSAANPEARSSRITLRATEGSRSSANAIGLDREPGERNARRTPQRVSSSTRAEARAVFLFVVSII